MTQVRSIGLTIFIYSGTQPARIVGTPQAGEVDWRSVVTSANTIRIVRTSNAGQSQTLLPGNNFSGFTRLEPGGQYAIQGRSSFTLPLSFPVGDATVQGNALSAVRSAIDSAAGLPVAAFVFTNNNGTVLFNPTGSTPGNGSFILGYDWDFGDGSPIDFGNAPNHVYTAVGTYTARLRVMNNNNVRSNWVSRSVVITVAGSASPSPSPNPSPVPGGSLYPTGAPSGYVQRSAATNGTTIKEYWLGNSVSDTRKDATNGAGVASLASQNGYTHTYARGMVPGAPLDFLYNNAQNAGFTTSPYGFYPNALANYKWDIVTFQPFDRPADNDLQHIQLFLDIVAGSSQYANSSEFPRPWIYQRWPRKRDPGVNDAAYWESQYARAYNPSQFFYESQNFFDVLLNLVRTNETRFKKALLIPVGDCMRLFNSRAAAGQIPNFVDSWGLYQDGIHLTNTGAFYVTMVFYSAFYYRSPVGLTVPAPYGAIDPSLVTLMQNQIWEVVQNHSHVAYFPSSEA